ncbi:GNAT family N-acetyltransferase [Caulifigura coniformis]|nr:GNAT family N-acetyltransferase [Caulifigura coniformis]
MFRIRRIYDDLVPVNQNAILECQRILQSHFSGVTDATVELLIEKLRNPFRQKFRSILYVAERGHGTVQGFAFAMHDPELKFCYLDYLATDASIRGRGIGAALYERVRDETRYLGGLQLYFECLPDSPAACRDPVVRAQNEARLRFYERYGARPVINTAYETPFNPAENDNVPHLMVDRLDLEAPLTKDRVRLIVRAILDRKYGSRCPPGYVDKVVASFQEDPVQLRPFRWKKPSRPAGALRPDRPDRRIPVVINDQHDIHHIRERGYVEAPVRIAVIRQALEEAGLIEVRRARSYPTSKITAVHDRDYVSYLEKACENAPPGKSVYPYVFPVRNVARPPRELSIRAGYYCIDTFTPIHRNAYRAARGGAECALTAADEVLHGQRLAYALVRPPGHHAERKFFGGFCYFNNAAIAAEHLSRSGKVAILDIDYHHGNGQQEIFLSRADVLTVSLHADPRIAYPFFSGFADERGIGPGEGFNLNVPLPDGVTGTDYRRELARALAVIARFKPMFLVVSLGFDVVKGDPTGTWLLTADDLEKNARMIGELDVPTLVVQEGGYRTRTLGINARRFFTGLVESTIRR